MGRTPIGGQGRRTRRGRRQLSMWGMAAVFGALAVLGSACVVPQARFGDLRTSDWEDTLPPDYQAPTPAFVETGVAYGPSPHQVVDIYRPNAVADDAPIFLYLHGGGWTGGSTTPVPALFMRQVTRMHAVLVSVNYALATTGDPTTSFPAAPRDVDRAIRWVKAHADQWGGSRRVIAVGQSAGANLALLAATAPGVFVAPDLPPELDAWSPRLAGVVSLAGPVNIASMYAIDGWHATVLDPYLGCTPCTDPQIAAASPLSYLDGSAPPVYLAYATDDWLIPPDIHGLPTAVAWMNARGEQGREPADRSVWYELVVDDHDIDHWHMNMRHFEIWLDFVAESRFATTP